MGKRKAGHDIEPLILNRWSPRAMSGDRISEPELMTLFEAARWAPSSYNNQPWRFLYAMRNTPAWDRFMGLMVQFNQSWANKAAVLIVIVSHDLFDSSGKPARTHSFDTGAAWQNLALQGHKSGLVVHGMEGFDYARAKEELGIPTDYTVEAMVAVGKPGKIEDLPKELQEKEQMSDRKPLNEIVFQGAFGKQ